MRNDVIRIERMLIAYLFIEWGLSDNRGERDEAERSIELLKLMMEIEQLDKELVQSENLQDDQRHSLEESLISRKLRYVLKYYQLGSFTNFIDDWASTGMCLTSAPMAQI